MPKGQLGSCVGSRAVTGSRFVAKTLEPRVEQGNTPSCEWSRLTFLKLVHGISASAGLKGARGMFLNTHCQVAKSLFISVTVSFDLYAGPKCMP